MLGCGAALVVALGGCGGSRQDANEPSGTYKVAIEQARFPVRQSLAKGEVMQIVVRNADTRTIPIVGVTINSFSTRIKDPGVSDPSRPVWIVNRGPRGGDTAYVGTWTLGSLPPGHSRVFRWHVTPVRSGLRRVRYTINAGLDGKAKAVLPSGAKPTRSFIVAISPKPGQAVVDDNGNVVRTKG